MSVQFIELLQNEHGSVTTSQLKMWVFLALQGLLRLLYSYHHLPPKHRSYFCYHRFVLPIFELSVNRIIQLACFYFWTLSLNIIFVKLIYIVVRTSNLEFLIAVQYSTI